MAQKGKLNLKSKYPHQRGAQPLGEGIYFYAPEDEYGYFSNYYSSPFYVNGKRYDSCEHYFQSKKHEGTSLEEKIRLCDTADKAKKMANADKLNDQQWQVWEKKRLTVMRTGLRFKFMQNEDLRKKLVPDSISSTAILSIVII